MSKYRNADPSTEQTFQRDDRVGRGWRKRYSRENDGKFIKENGEWKWKHNGISVTVPTTKKFKFKASKDVD